MVRTADFLSANRSSILRGISVSWRCLIGIAGWFVTLPTTRTELNQRFTKGGTKEAFQLGRPWTYRPEYTVFQFNTEGIGPETEGFQLNQCPTRGTPVLHEGGPNVALPKEDFNQSSTSVALPRTKGRAPRFQLNI